MFVLRNLFYCSLNGYFIRCVPLRILFNPRLAPRNSRPKFRTLHPNCPVDYNLYSFQTLDIIKFVVDVQIGLCNVNIIALENYECHEK